MVCRLVRGACGGGVYLSELRARMNEEIRHAAAMAGIPDEQRIIHDFARVISAARSMFEMDEAWRNYIAPVESAISDETLALAGRLYSLRVSTLRPEWDQ